MLRCFDACFHGSPSREQKLCDEGHTGPSGKSRQSKISEPAFGFVECKVLDASELEDAECLFMGFMQDFVQFHNCIVRNWIYRDGLVDDRPKNLGNPMFDIGVENGYKIVLWSWLR